MNARIQELAEQCYQIEDPHGRFPREVLNPEKFAELIVRECINKVRSRQMFGIEDEHNIHHAFDLLVYDLESHFGVDE
jgi:hypothetical protein